MREYQLRAGDSLAAIAYEEYGSVSEFRAIAQANDLDLFAALPIGRVIKLPDLVAALESAIATRLPSLDLSTLKQPETGLPSQLVSWII